MQYHGAKWHRFYTGGAWLRVRGEVLAGDRFECQRCKGRGRYRRANTVHHVRAVEQFPELSLCKVFVGADGLAHRNLISLCRQCHEEIHGRGAGCVKAQGFVTVEKF